jgi:hypothetical protein
VIAYKANLILRKGLKMNKVIGSKDCFRMKKKILFALTISLFFLAVITNAHSQDDMALVDNDVFENPRRPPAVFRHDAHNELAQIEECSVCHHVYDEIGRLVEDESSEDQRCSDCHELKTSGGQPALMKAFHTNCKGCHKANKNGPVMCGQCHVRNPISAE